MKLITIFLSLTILYSSAGVHACELTDEYKATRNEITTLARGNYNQCKASTSQAQYWYSFTQCIEQGEDSGTCEYMIRHGEEKLYKQLSLDPNHCNILWVTSKEIRAIFEEHIKEKSILKCKVTEQVAPS